MRRLGAHTPALTALLATLALTLALPATASSAAPQATGAATVKHNPFDADWTEKVVDAGQNFRGLAAVSKREAWVTGESTTDPAGPAKVYRTTDRGETWADVSPVAEKPLSFRDVEVHGGVVHVLAIGPGDDSRIYRSVDHGATWTEAFRNDDPDAFYDCMAFYPGGQKGLAVSDPVDGKLRILSTRDAGQTWSVLSNAGMPDSADEYGFAASGSCLETAGKAAFLITGGKQSRVLRSDDRGLTWTAVTSGIPAKPAGGGFAGDFASPRRGIAVGGDFEKPSVTTDNVAYTRDGHTWQSGGSLTHVGEDVAYVRGWKLAVATGDYRGSVGSSMTRDGGATWTRVSDLGYHVVDCVAKVCWAAGSGGRVGRG